MQDVLIIGGGMAGASAAYWLAPERRVSILEAEPHCGMHMMGRSAALFIEGYGNAAIRAFTRASRAFFTAPPDGFCEGRLLSARGCLVIGSPDRQVTLRSQFAEVGSESAVPMEWLDPDQVRAAIPLLRPDYPTSGYIDHGAMDMDVDALHQGFLRGARRAGAQIQTNARVEQIDRKDGVWTVTTAAGAFSAPVLVNAAGAWADHIATLAGAVPLGLVPKRRTALLVEPPPGADIAAWPAVTDVDEQYYFKPSSGMLLLSPADETPSDPCDAQPDEMDIAIAVDRVQRAVAIPVRHISRSWAGLRSFFRDKTPAVGWDAKAEGFFWLAGQGGYGIQTAPALGQTAAALLTDRDVPAVFYDTGADPALLSPARFG